MSDEKDMGPFTGMDPKLIQAITGYGTPPYREMVTVKVRDVGNYSFDELPTTIEDWIEWLAEARAETPEAYRAALQSVLTFDESYYDSGASASFQVWYERPETDAEMTARVNRGLAYIGEREANEKATYEALKRKFG